jgi:trimeric autotransporter adhesin
MKALRVFILCAIALSGLGLTSPNRSPHNNGGDSGGTAAPPYEGSFSATTTLTVAAATHGMGTNPVPLGCWNNATPRVPIAQDAGFPTIAANGDVVFDWTGSATGVCKIISGSASGTAGGDLAGTYPNPTIATNALNFSELAGTAADGQIPNTITIDLATTATTANAGDSATSFFSSGTIDDARVDGSAESDEVTGLTDAQISDTLTASTSTTASANDSDTSIATTAFVQQELDDVDLLSDNCILENDGTPIPDSCVGDGVDSGSGGGGTVTALDSSDGFVDIANPTTTPDITLGAALGAISGATDNTMIAAASSIWNFALSTFSMPVSGTCAPGSGATCFDNTGVAGATSPLLVLDVSGTDYYAPMLANVGTAGTKRALGLGTGDATETTLVTATPTASAIPLADGSNKLADGWLSSLVMLSSSFNTTAEVQGSGLAFMAEPNDGAGCSDGEVVGYGSGVSSCVVPISDFADIATGRDDPDNYGTASIGFAFVVPFAGDPNGDIACDSATPTELLRKMVRDTTNNDLYVCTGTGNAATATWEALYPVSGSGVSDGDRDDITVSASGATWTVDTGAINFTELAGTATDAQIPNTITVDLAATANAGDSATAFFSAGTIEDARIDGSAESDEVTGLTDAQISDTLTASTSTTAAANDSDTSIATTAFVQQELTGYAADTATLTNKTLSAEGTGNVVTIPVKISLEAASCAGTTGTLQWDTLATEAPTATCTAGSTNTAMMRGVADFANSGQFQMQRAFQLPSDFDAASNLDAAIKWRGGTSGNVFWQIATACSADGAADDVTWNSPGTVADAAKGDATHVNDAAITNIDKTGCAAGETLHVRILRDSNHGSDSTAATASLMSIELTYRRAM